MSTMTSHDYVARHRGTGKTESIDIFNNGDYTIPNHYQYQARHVKQPETPAPKPAKLRGASLAKRLLSPLAIPKP